MAKHVYVKTNPPFPPPVPSNSPQTLGFYAATRSTGISRYYRAASTLADQPARVL